MTEDEQFAAFAMLNATMTMMRETMQHLVEEGLMDGSRAAQICTNAAERNMPEEQSSGEKYDLGRDYLLAVAKAFRQFPT